MNILSFSEYRVKHFNSYLDYEAPQSPQLPDGSCHRPGHVYRAAFLCLHYTTPSRGSLEHGSDLTINNIMLKTTSPDIIVVTSSVDEVDAVIGRCVSPAGGSLPQITLLDHLFNGEVGGDLVGAPSQISYHIMSYLMLYLVGAHGRRGSMGATNHIVLPTVLLCLGTHIHAYRMVRFVLNFLKPGATFSTGFCDSVAQLCKAGSRIGT